jgi:hypothetical protein
VFCVELVAEAAAEPVYDDVPACEPEPIELHSSELLAEEVELDEPELSEPVLRPAWHRNPLVDCPSDESEFQESRHREPLLGELLAAA